MIPPIKTAPPSRVRDPLLALAPPAPPAPAPMATEIGVPGLSGSSRRFGTCSPGLSPAAR